MSQCSATAPPATRPQAGSLSPGAYRSRRQSVRSIPPTSRPIATPDIGNYSFEDFVRVMRLGVTPDGTRLYPAMPYTAYAKVSDEDLQDLFAYLQSGLAPVEQARRPSAIPWPLSMRWPLALWNLAFHDNSRFVADGSKDEQWNRGAYLVQGLTHCGTCHTPRGIALRGGGRHRKERPLSIGD